MIVLSHYQTRPLLAARRQQQAVAPVSPDLGLTTVEARVTPEGIVFPGGERVTWEALERITETENQCFRVTPEGIDDCFVAFSDAPAAGGATTAAGCCAGFA